MTSKQTCQKLKYKKTTKNKYFLFFLSIPRKSMKHLLLGTLRSTNQYPRILVSSRSLTMIWKKDQRSHSPTNLHHHPIVPTALATLDSLEVAMVVDPIDLLTMDIVKMPT